MEISCQRYEEIKEVVAQTFRLAGVDKLPICPFMIAHALEFKQLAYSSLSSEKQEACLELSAEGFILNETIYYNDLAYDKRARFTLMHEIGHIMLNHRTESRMAEKEANFFARYALAPPILILANDQDFEMDKLKIRELFDVSPEVSEYVYESYQKWIEQLCGSIPKEPYDVEIYNLIYRSSTGQQKTLP